MANDGTGNGWDTLSPANGALISQGAQEIRDLRLGSGTRLGKEHVDPAAGAIGGEHIAGSAMIYYGASAPTKRPDGSTNLNTSDIGRLWMDSDDGQFYMWLGSVWSAFTFPTANLANLAVTTGKILDANVTTAKLADAAVTTVKIADANITSAKIATGAVGDTQLAAANKATKVTVIQDKKTNGTDAGTFTTGAWRTRALNDVPVNELSITPSGNQFTLTAGTYEVTASAPAMEVGNHAIRLRNVTDSTTTAVGTLAYSRVTSSQTTSCLSTKFTIAGSKTYEIQHYCQSTVATHGLGFAADTLDGSVECIYAQVTIKKVG